MDSLGVGRDVLGEPTPVSCEFVRVAEQETNDLDKAIRLCRERGWGDLVVVGATGLREDHAIGNVYRALSWRSHASYSPLPIKTTIPYRHRIYAIIPQ